VADCRFSSSLENQRTSQNDSQVLLEMTVVSVPTSNSTAYDMVGSFIFSQGFVCQFDGQRCCVEDLRNDLPDYLLEPLNLF
jgi:hypothetical protein